MRGGGSKGTGRGHTEAPTSIRIVLLLSILLKILFRGNFPMIFFFDLKPPCDSNPLGVQTKKLRPDPG